MVPGPLTPGGGPHSGHSREVLPCPPTPCELRGSSPQLWGPFLAPGANFLKDSFSTDLWDEGWFRDDSRVLHLLCTLFLLVLHQLHLRASGIRSSRLGTPALGAGRLKKAPGDSGDLPGAKEEEVCFQASWFPSLLLLSSEEGNRTPLGPRAAF